MRAFFVVVLFGFFFLKAQSPGAVALLRIAVLLLQRKESENLRNVSVGPERSCSRRAWVHCERALLPRRLQACGFCKLALLIVKSAINSSPEPDSCTA